MIPARYLILITLISCASQDKKEEALEEWEGKNVSELNTHPYFKDLPVTKVNNKSGIETWVLRDQTRFQTDAYCESLGGCLGMPSYNCNHIFSVRNDLILDYDQKGTCPGTKRIESVK